MQTRLHLPETIAFTTPNALARAHLLAEHNLPNAQTGRKTFHNSNETFAPTNLVTELNAKLGLLPRVRTDTHSAKLVSSGE